jgi:formylglycine-generating enzyme required for sulfatase activity
LLLALHCWLPVAAEEACTVPGGEYKPLYTLGEQQVKVRPFRLAAYPVTNAQYLEFVRAHPKWRRSQVKRVFAEANYLKGWTSDLSYDPSLTNSPVVHVSWFAARAYCQAQGGRLPTQDEWELAARADESSADATAQASFRKRILDWYSKPTPTRLAAVGSTFKNVYGVHDMHGLVWEWVDDFNSILLTGESRGDDALDRNLYCAAGVSGSTDPGDYAAYMRYAFRSSLKSNYTLGNLGFRMARDPAQKRKSP